MPIINNLNNDQNIIGRVRTKMSDRLSGQNNSTKLLNSPEALNYICEISKNKSTQENLSPSLANSEYERNNCENGVLDSIGNSSCQNAESEVKFLKEWLGLHLDLIQQQNDDLLNKEKTILILQQENEMLKERISCMERGSPFHPTKFFSDQTQCSENFAEDMTQDSTASEEDSKERIALLDLECDDVNNCSSPLDNFKNHDMNDNEKCAENFLRNASTCHRSQHINSKSETNDCVSANVRSDTSKSVNTVLKFNNTNFTVHTSSSDFDPMKELKMNIRRKRLCSNSSVLSNNDSLGEEKRSRKRMKRRRKKLGKDDHVLMTPEQYVTQVGEVAYGLINEQEIAMEMAAAAADSANLEVPRWRVKVYTSCYSMEGTENLDDEVYNKRHSRLENDERRRKRWDVQRIREQRIIEKLKQRQERTGPGSKSDDQQDPVQSLWPTVDDIRYLEVCDQLPVSALGCPIPHFPTSEFSLPWLNNPNRSAKKISTRKSSTKRRSSRR